jgi:hypothetical protein
MRTPKAQVQNYVLYSNLNGARGNEVVKALCYKLEGLGLKTRLGDFFSIYLILAAALGPGVYSASNINEYQKQKMFLGSRARPVRKDNSLAAICELIV